MLVMMEMHSLSLHYYDPLVKNIAEETSSLELELVGRFFQDLAISRGQPYKPAGWRQNMHRDVPGQPDTVNCGLYVMMYANLLGRDMDI